VRGPGPFSLHMSVVSHRATISMRGESEPASPRQGSANTAATNTAAAVVLQVVLDVHYLASYVVSPRLGLLLPGLIILSTLFIFLG